MVGERGCEEEDMVGMGHAFQWLERNKGPRGLRDREKER